MNLRLRPAWLAWLGLFLATGVWAQAQKQGTITSAQCVPIATDAAATVGIQITGTWSGTLQPEVAIQGQAAVNVQVTPSTSTTAQSTITANGVYTAAVAGASTFLICGNTVASGTANVYLNATSAVRQAAPGSSATGTVTSIATTSPITGGTITTTGTIACATCAIGPGASTANHIAEFSGTDGLTLKDGGAAGTGTVTNTGASLPTGAVVIGNTSPDIKADTALSTDGAGSMTDTQGTITTSKPLMSHTVTWNAAGVAFSDWLSNVTCTAAATASIAGGWGVGGTTWQLKFNGATCTNPQFIIPVGGGAAPSIAFTGHLGDGFYWDGAGPSIAVGTTDTFTCFSAACQSRIDFVAQTAVYLISHSHLLISATAPTIAAAGCGGSGASIPVNNGTASFRINVGTSNTGTCTVTMPAATTNWNCFATDITTKSTSVAQTQQTSASTGTSLVLQNYTDVMATGAWTDSDVLSVNCSGN